MKSNIIKKIKSLTPKEVIMAMVEGLPYLTDYYTQESLIPYIKLAESQS